MTFQRDPLGLDDLGELIAAKPCCRRMNTTPLSWCTRPKDHDGPCSAPPMRQIELDDTGPGYRRRW